MIAPLQNSLFLTGKILGPLMLALVFAWLMSPIGLAQNPTNLDAGPYMIGFYTGANQGLPDAQMHIVNPGSTGGTGNPNNSPAAIPAGGDICANVYVFTSDQQMISCCSCKISPNGMQGFSLATDLLGSPLTSIVPIAGAIKVLSSASGGSPGNLPPPAPGALAAANTACDAGTFYQPTGQLQTWITHVRTLGAAFGAPDSVTEIPFSGVRLSESEYDKLVQTCFAIESAPGPGGVSIKAQDTTVTANCSPFPEVYNNGAGSAAVSCPAFSNPPLSTLTSVSLGYVADYQFGSNPGPNMVPVVFTPAGPTGVTWSPSTTTLTVVGGPSSGSEPTGTANATGGVTGTNFAAPFNVNVSSSVSQGTVATSSGAVTVTYTFTTMTPPPPPPTKNCICDPKKAM
jgi:hypothetical protein